MSRLEWMHDGLCTEIGGEMFFPKTTDGTAQAKAICRRCPVQPECLDHALALQDNGVWQVTGIWGGTTSRERRALRRRTAA